MTVITGKKPSEFSVTTKKALILALNTPQYSDSIPSLVLTGLAPPVSETLTSQIAAGVAHIEGVRVAKEAESHTFSPSKDTYIDLSSAGVYTFVEVENGAAKPALTANSIRTALVIASETAITNVYAYNTNLAIGTNALSNAKNGILETVAIGYNALASVDQDGVEFDNGKYNVAVGYNALKSNTTGNHNTAIGWHAGGAITTGSNNTAIGQDALLFLKTADFNVAVGGHAGMYITGEKNTVVGNQAGENITTGTNNVLIGHRAGVKQWAQTENMIQDTNCVIIGSSATVDRTDVPAPFTNAIAIGFAALVKKSNSAVIGNSNIVDVYLGGTEGAAKLNCSKAKFTAIPTSADGLSAGEIWSDGGTLKIV